MGEWKKKKNAVVIEYLSPEKSGREWTVMA